MLSHTQVTVVRDRGGPVPLESLETLIISPTATRAELQTGDEAIQMGVQMRLIPEWCAPCQLLTIASISACA